jgi:hypothetical protein
VSLSVVTRPAAAAEIETAYRWYENERAGLGSEFLEAVDKLVRTIAEDPERFPVISKGRPTRCAAALPIQHFLSHRFRAHRGDCVFHGKRNPKVWRGRE